jgi:hypothetical protein
MSSLLDYITSTTLILHVDEEYKNLLGTIHCESTHLSRRKNRYFMVILVMIHFLEKNCAMFHCERVV